MSECLCPCHASIEVRHFVACCDAAVEFEGPQQGTLGFWKDRCEKLQAENAAQAGRIEKLEAVLQAVVDETAHLDCYPQSLTNKIIAALPPQGEK